MVGFAHVVLHLSLCTPMASLPPSATVDVKLRLVDNTGRQHVDYDFSVPRGESMTHTINFDAPRGTFRATMLAAQGECGMIDYWAFISESPRTIEATLATTPPPQEPLVLLDGRAPESFLSADPQFALLPKNTPCATPISDPPPAKFRLENDGSSFYVWMNLNDIHDSLLALQVETATGEYHYVRLRPKLDTWTGFPSTVEIDLSEDTLDWLAGQPVDTLLCPHMYWSSVSN